MLSPSRELRRRSTRPPRSCSIEKVGEGSGVSHPMRVRLQGPPLSHWNSTRALVSRKPSPKTKKGRDRSRTPAPARNSEREGVMGGGVSLTPFLIDPDAGWGHARNARRGAVDQRASARPGVSTSGAAPPGGGDGAAVPGQRQGLGQSEEA